MKIVQQIKRLPTVLIVVLFSLFAVFPFYIMIVMGTYESEELFKGLKLLPGSSLLKNAQVVFSRGFLQFYVNSLFVSSFTTIGGVLISTAAGFAFAKYTFKFKDTIFFFILGTIMIPSQLGLIGYLMELRWLGLSNTHLALILPGLANAFGVFWMRQYISSAIPNELIESARIDGCGDFKIFSSIVFPNIKPATVTMFLLFLLWSWNSYLLPLVVLNNERKYTVPLGISLLSNAYRTDYSASILALTFCTLPILILFSIGSKSLIQGLIAGSIKG